MSQGLYFYIKNTVALVFDIGEKLKTLQLGIIIIYFENSDFHITNKTKLNGKFITLFLSNFCIYVIYYNFQGITVWLYYLPNALNGTGQTRRTAFYSVGPSLYQVLI